MVTPKSLRRRIRYVSGRLSITVAMLVLAVAVLVLTGAGADKADAAFNPRNAALADLMNDTATLPALGSPGARKTVRVVFKDSLFMERDIMLRGTHAQAVVNFTRPASWKLLPGSTLHLFYTHSGILLPEHSALTLRIGEASKTLRLDEQDGSVREAVVPIDIDRIDPFSAVMFSADQHYTLDCEDPFHAGLWTRISSDSYLEFVYEELPVLTDLAVFPYPYFDALAYPPSRLSYVMPHDASAETMTALANITAAIAQEIAYRPLETDFLEQRPSPAENHLIVVGTLRENPEAGALLSAAGIALPSGENGLIASIPLPGDLQHAALVITGETPAAVLKAASALVDRSTRATYAGKYALVSGYEPKAPAKPRDWPGFVPDRTDFTFQDLGFSGETVRGYYSAPVLLDVKMQPDAKPIEFRQRLNIHYAYSAETMQGLSTIEVRLNDHSLHSAPLDKPEGSESEWLSIDVPFDLYGAFNRLEINFHLVPKRFKPCEPVSDWHLWGTVFPDSNFSLPKDYWLEVPNLAAVSRWAFPFSVRADFSESAIILPSPKNRDAQAGMLRLFALLATGIKDQNPRVDVYYQDQVPEEVLRTRHLIVVAPDDNGSVGTTLRSRALTLSAGERVELKAGEQERLRGIVRDGGLTIEEISSPWNDQRVVLVLQQSKATQLSSLPAKALAPDAFDRLRVRGTVAVISEPDNVNTIDLGPTSLLGHIPFWRRLRYLFSIYWELFLVLAALGVFLLFTAMRRLLARRKRRIEAASAG